MKLFYSPGACSLAPHIVANELGLKIETVKVDLKAHKTEKGEDYYKIAPKGSVPALLLDNGELLTEGPAISQYMCSLKSEQKLLPSIEDLRRYRVLEWLNFITSELHKNYGNIFAATREYANEQERDAIVKNAKTRLAAKYAVVETALSENGPYLTGTEFSPADAYLYVVTSWAKPIGVDLSAFPKVMGFWEAVNGRPSVQKARAEEGLKVL